MITKINSTPINNLPDQDLHEKMFYLQNDVDDYLSETIINDKIELFKNTMKNEQNILVTTTHRNSLIQAEIETKDEYLRLNQGSGESVLDMKNKSYVNNQENDVNGLSEVKNNYDSNDILGNNNDDKDFEIYRKNKMFDNNKKNNHNDANNKMKSKFEGLRDYIKPKGEKTKRKPDENSQLDYVKNSVSVDLMKEKIESEDSENKENMDYEYIEENDNRKEDGEEGRDGNGQGSEEATSGDEVEEISEKEISKRAKDRKEQKDRLEIIDAIRREKGYLIDWG